MSAITKFASGKPCTARIPHGFGHDPATSVWAHIRGVRWGAGMGKKPPDFCGLIACSMCHDIIDGRVQTDMERDFIKMCAMEGHLESLALLHKEGLV